MLQFRLKLISISTHHFSPNQINVCLASYLTHPTFVLWLATPFPSLIPKRPHDSSAFLAPPITQCHILSRLSYLVTAAYIYRI